MQEHQLAEVAEVRKMPKPSLGVKAKLYDELKRFLMIFAYLWLVFLVFLVHEWIVLADNHIGFNSMASLRSTPWSFPRSCSSRRNWDSPKSSTANRWSYRSSTNPCCSRYLLVVAYILEEIILGWFHGEERGQ